MISTKAASKGRSETGQNRLNMHNTENIAHASRKEGVEEGEEGEGAKNPKWFSPCGT
jgi:hypothetical protein